MTTGGDEPGLSGQSGGVSSVTPAGNRTAVPAATARSTRAGSLRAKACSNGWQFKATTTSARDEDGGRRFDQDVVGKFAAIRSPACDGEGRGCSRSQGPEYGKQQGGRARGDGSHVGKVRFREDGKGPSNGLEALVETKRPRRKTFTDFLGMPVATPSVARAS